MDAQEGAEAAAQLSSGRRLWAVLGTLLLPVGTGHIVLGRPRRALGWALALLVLNLSLLWSGVPGVVLVVAVGLFSMLDVALLLRRPQRWVPPLRWVLPVFLAWVAVTYGARWYVRHGLVEPWRVPSSGMAPTLHLGDHFIADHRLVGERPPLAGLLFPGRLPEPGEVIVFRHPGEPEKTLVQRVVALPGEVVALDAEGLRIGGRRAQRRSLGACEEGELTEAAEDAGCELYEETLGAHRYRVAQLVLSPGSAGLSAGNCPAGTEPADGGCRVLPAHVFVLGDNRDNSFDSRYLGAVPLANVKGAARYVHFSFGGDRTIHWERIGATVD